jgi:hypothetical protein
VVDTVTLQPPFGFSGDLLLVFGNDTEGVENTGKCGLWPDAKKGVFVENVVNPWDLRDLSISGNM